MAKWKGVEEPADDNAEAPREGGKKRKRAADDEEQADINEECFTKRGPGFDLIKIAIDRVVRAQKTAGHQPVDKAGLITNCGRDELGKCKIAPVKALDGGATMTEEDFQRRAQEYFSARYSDLTGKIWSKQVYADIEIAGLHPLQFRYLAEKVVNGSNVKSEVKKLPF